MRVSIRNLRDTDLPLLLAWSHIKEIWTYMPTSRSKENLTWEKHFDWWRGRKNRFDWMILVNLDEYGPRPVGVVKFEYKGGGPSEIGIYIGEVTLWDKGVAAEALRLALDEVAARYRSISAVIHPENQRSIRLFTGLGFKKVGKARSGQEEYRLHADFSM